MIFFSTTIQTSMNKIASMYWSGQTSSQLLVGSTSHTIAMGKKVSESDRAVNTELRVPEIIKIIQESLLEFPG